MQGAHIRLAVDPRSRPIEFTERLWASAGTPWAGFDLEAHRVGPWGRLKDFAVPDTLLGLCVEGAAALHVGPSRQAIERVVRPGHFTVLSPGEEQRPITWFGTRETLYVRLPDAQVQRLMGEGARGPWRLAPQYAAAEPQVARLVLNMRDEARAGGSAGRLYAESLSLALACLLFDRYAKGGGSAAAAAGGAALSRAQAARVRDYVQAHLGRNISLVELAELTGLSPHHFSLVFKRSFDATPHHYLLAQRVEHAKRLIAVQRLSIGEAALEAGFANQSHFTRVFRRLTGQTPRQFQRA